VKEERPAGAGLQEHYVRGALRLRSVSLTRDLRQPLIMKTRKKKDGENGDSRRAILDSRYLTLDKIVKRRKAKNLKQPLITKARNGENTKGKLYNFPAFQISCFRDSI